MTTNTMAARTKADDIQEISKVLSLYCRAMDRMDVELGYSIWHEDGEADYGVEIFQGSGHGFVDYVTGLHTGMLCQSHQLTTTIIELQGADYATSEAYVTAILRYSKAGVLKQMTAYGRYLDHWSHRDNRWAIDKRVYLHDFGDIRTIEQPHLSTQPRRDRSDVSYAVLDRIG